MVKKGKVTGGRSAFGGYKFFEVPLAAADKERLTSIDGEAEFPFTGIGALVEQGYKVSFSEDSRNNTFIASLTDNRADSPFHKHILTGRGDTVGQSWVSLCYKHFYLANEDWTNIAKVDLGGGWG